MKNKSAISQHSYGAVDKNIDISNVLNQTDFMNKTNPEFDSKQTNFSKLRKQV